MQMIIGLIARQKVVHTGSNTQGLQRKCCIKDSLQGKG